MAETTMNRRQFMAMASVGVAAPLIWPDSLGATQAGPAPPTNVRVVSATPGSVNRQLLGGWRVAQEFARGTIAIDFATNRLWMAGNAQRAEILEYQLTSMGSGADINAWPRLDPVRVIPAFWQGGNTYGLCFFRGKLWVSPRIYYAQNDNASASLTIYAEDGERITTNLLKQKFSGFVKRGPGIDPLLGGGGYESGQGTVSGPTLATLAGQRLIEYQWPGAPGANLENWNLRAPREPNYSVARDSWVGWKPRVINGELQGRWASDRVYGGGLVLPEGVVYWPWMGTGPLDYDIQTYTFAPDNLNRTYAYRYDPATYKFLGYEARPEFGWGPIYGQELDASGRVYLAHGNQWKSGIYTVDVALRVYG